MDRGTRVVDLYTLAADRFAAAVSSVPEQAWSAATPCTDWDVRTLTNHVVGEDRWVPPLVDGKTIEDVGDALDGDLLGTDPAAAASLAGNAAVAALAEPGALGRTVHLSFGDFTAEDYGWQVLVDHVVHTWDLLAGSGQDRALDAALVDAAAGWWADWAEAYRGAGAVAAPIEVAADASSQDRLIASFGRDPAWTA
jgi:uncharacterized protein (TIGR03086 family)